MDEVHVIHLLVPIITGKPVLRHVLVRIHLKYGLVQRGLTGKLLPRQPVFLSSLVINL